MIEILREPVTWTAAALALFVVIMIILGVPGMLTKALDGRAAIIRAELEEARRLREEAQRMLANYQRQEREAHKEAEAIIAEARAEAQRTASEAHAELDALIERRRRQAEEKIARAEQQALDDIRGYAASVSVGAARRFIRKELDEKQAGPIVDSAIADLPERLRSRS